MRSSCTRWMSSVSIDWIALFLMPCAAGSGVVRSDCLPLRSRLAKSARPSRRSLSHSWSGRASSCALSVGESQPQPRGPTSG